MHQTLPLRSTKSFYEWSWISWSGMTAGMRTWGLVLTMFQLPPHPIPTKEGAYYAHNVVLPQWIKFWKPQARLMIFRSFQAHSILVGSILVIFASMKIRMILQKLFQSNLLYLFFYTNCAAQCTSKCKTFVWSSRKSENTIGTLNCWKSTVNFLKQSWFWKKAICHPRSLNSIRSSYVCFSFGVYYNQVQCFACLANL